MNQTGLIHMPRCAATVVVLCVLAACDKETPREAKPAPHPVVAPAPTHVLPPDDYPAGKITWIKEAVAWERAKPGRQESAGFKVLYFRAPREYGCGLLERLAFNDAAVLDHFQRHAVARFENLDPASELARRYDVKDVPCLVVMDAEGGYAGALLGHRPPARLLNDLLPLTEKAAAQLKRAADLEAHLKSAAPGKGLVLLDTLAEQCMERRLFERAAELLDELLKQPDLDQARSRVQVWARYGQALAELNRAAEAERAFEQALVADTLKLQTEELSFRRAQAQTLCQQHDRAVELWAAFVDDQPKSTRRGAAAFNLVYELLQAGRREEAARQIEKFLRDGLPTVPTEALRSLLYVVAGQDRALKNLLDNTHERQRVADALDDGRDLVRKYSCTDCHLLIEPQLRPAQQTCVECHLLIKGLERDPDKHDHVLLAHPHFFRNCSRVQHLLRAPNLFGLGARVRPDWIRKFLESPYDVRPHLEESMIPMNLEAQEIEALVRYFRAIASVFGQTPPEDAAAQTGAPKSERERKVLAERGHTLFIEKKCQQCHQFGNTRFDAEQGSWDWLQGRAEAPNLRFARDRLTRHSATEWIREPAKMSPGTRMPQFELKQDEIVALVEYLFSGDLGEPPPTREPRPKIKLAHASTWEEVNVTVFQNTCVHCHGGDGGAGVTGAYGYRARRLDLSSYAGVRRGALRADGSRENILTSRKGDLPPLILERVQRRVVENQRDFIEPFRDPLTDLTRKREGHVKPGMPLGHPALTPEQMGVLESWLEAGAPGPQPAPLDGTEKKTGLMGE